LKPPWDKLEAIFEQRTAKALSKMGVPTATDVDALVKRVDALAAQVAKLRQAEVKKTAAKKSSSTRVEPNKPWPNPKRRTSVK
jgi:hypothetical protein